MTPKADELIARQIRPAYWLFPPSANSPQWFIWRRIYGDQFLDEKRVEEPPVRSAREIFWSWPSLTTAQKAKSGQSLGRGWRDYRSALGALGAATEWLQEQYVDELSESVDDRLPDARITELDVYLAARHQLLHTDPALPPRRPKRVRRRPFMKKKMEPVEVEITDDGSIRLSSFSRDGKAAEIMLDPAQVGLLCEWLREARDSILSSAEKQ